MKLWIVAGIVLALNLPFGYWRSTLRRFSLSWFLSIHLPVPMVVALRFSAGLGWHLVTFPVLIGAFTVGQLLGGKILSRRRAAVAPASISQPTTSGRKDVAGEDRGLHQNP